ncbi:unnamed protein product [Lathyrus oleraceus]
MFLSLLLLIYAKTHFSTLNPSTTEVYVDIFLIGAPIVHFLNPLTFLRNHLNLLGTTVKELSDQMIIDFIFSISSLHE